MSKCSSGFPTNITDNYYTLWENSINEAKGISYSLKQIFSLPDIADKDGLLIDVDKALINIAHGEILIAAIKGPAGSGKTSLISYLCNNSNIIDEDTGIMVWTLPEPMHLIPFVMGECSIYANKYNKSRMVLVFENISGLEINLERIVDIITQRQATLYPFISVIITCRDTEDCSTQSNCETLYIQPFSKEKILSFVRRYETINKETHDSHNSIISLIDIYGIETIGNPVILSLLLRKTSDHENIEISNAEDIYSLLINERISGKTTNLLEAIAYYMFTNLTEYIPEEMLYDHSISFDNELSMLFVFKDKNVSFIHRSLYEYSLAGCLASIIQKMSDSDINNRPLSQLYTLCSCGKFSKSMVAYFESKIKNNESVPHCVSITKIAGAFKLFLTGDLSTYYETNQQIKHLSFMSLLHKEMNTFYNMCTIYHSVIRIIGSTERFDHSIPIKKCFMNYLKLFSVFGDAELDLSEIDLSGQDFSNITLKHINLSFCNLRECSFNYSKLEKVTLKGANLCDSDLHGIQLQDVDLSFANLSNVNLSESRIHNSSLCSSNFNSADMYRCSMKTVNCKNSNFNGVNLDFAICTDGDFECANFSNSYLRNAVFNESNFENTNFSDVSI